VDLIIIFPVFLGKYYPERITDSALPCSDILFSFHSIVSSSCLNNLKSRFFTENTHKYSSIFDSYLEAANGLHAADLNHDRPKQGQDQPPHLSGPGIWVQFGVSLANISHISDFLDIALSGRFPGFSGNGKRANGARNRLILLLEE